MTKHESVEGICGRISIELDVESFAPGDVVYGSVKLHMSELVETKEPLAVIVQGREAVAWDEGSYDPVTNAFDKIFLHEKIELTPFTLYDVGDYVYRFEFQLPANVPSSFELADIYSETADRLRVQIKYQASVWLRSNSDLVAYLSAEQEFTVHASPTLPPPIGLEISASEVIRWLYCIKRGNVQMTLKISKDLYVSGEVVTIGCLVDGSACKTSMKSIVVELVEDIMLQNMGERPDWIVTRVLSTQQLAGPKAGKISEQVVKFGLVQIEEEKEIPINPDVMFTHYFYCTHRLIIRCTPFMAQNIVSEVPVRVLHHSTPFSSEAVSVLRLPAQVT